MYIHFMYVQSAHVSKISKRDVQQPSHPTDEPTQKKEKISVPLRASAQFLRRGKGRRRRSALTFESSEIDGGSHTAV